MHRCFGYLFNEDSGRGMVMTRLFYHTAFSQASTAIRTSEYWTRDEHRAYQWEQTIRLLRQAYDHVPYYRTLFDACGLQPSSVRSLDDLSKIPFLTKDIVRVNGQQLHATNYPTWAFEPTHTGGSTGDPLHFDIEKGVWYARHLAYMQSLLSRTGYRVGDRMAIVAGNTVPLSYRPLQRTVLLSSFFLTDAWLPRYEEALKRLKPSLLMGYPSALSLLGTSLREHGMRWSLRGVVCYGEALSSWQRSLLTEVFGCPVQSQYGNREQTVLAGSCEAGAAFHAFPQYSYLELIDAEGRPIDREGVPGEIVGTGFHTDCFPFIRYRTGDIGTLSHRRCACGREYPTLDEVQGRAQDYIVLASGDVIGLMGVQQFMANATSRAVRWQLIQEEPGEVTVLVVPREGYSAADEQRVRDEFSRRFGERLRLRFSQVDSITLSPHGKQLFLIQKLPVDLRRVFGSP